MVSLSKRYIYSIGLHCMGEDKYRYFLGCVIWVKDLSSLHLLLLCHIAFFVPVSSKRNILLLNQFPPFYPEPFYPEPFYANCWVCTAKIFGCVLN